MSRRASIAGLTIEAIFLIAVVGPFSLLSHGTDLTDLGKLTDHQPIAAVLITAGLIALFALYAFVLFSVPNGQTALPIALGGTALFSLTLIFLYPATAIDVYNYAVEGHVAVYHQINPMITAPSQAVGDTFVSYAGNWADSPSPYGPIWILLTMLDALVAGSNVVLAILLLKALAAVAVVATTFLLAWSFRDRGAHESALAAMLFGWNPLVQLELVGNGHNDAVLTLFVIAALVCLAKKQPTLGAIGIGASVLIKFLTLGAIPLLLLAKALDTTQWPRIRFARVVGYAVVIAALGVAAYAPFWTGPATLQRAQAVDGNYLSSISALIVLIVPNSIGWLTYLRFAILATVGLWQVNSLRLGRVNLAQAMYEIFFVSILVAAHFAGWYLALLVAVSVLTRDRWIQARTVVFTFTTTLVTPLWAYLWWWVQDWMSMTTIHWIVVPLTFVPPLTIALLAIWHRASRSRLRQGDRASYFDALYAELRNAYLSARSVVGSSS